MIGAHVKKLRSLRGAESDYFQMKILFQNRDWLSVSEERYSGELSVGFGNDASTVDIRTADDYIEGDS